MPAGIGTLTGFALAVEVGDWHRFTGRTIGSFVGLVPTEYSSGASRAQGPITKTGNGHARRLLVEAAWHHRSAYRPSKAMHERWALAPAAARARGDEGNRRLHHRWVGFIDRKKRHQVATIAIARELAGWCWSLADPRRHVAPSTPICFAVAQLGSSARSDPRTPYEQPPAAAAMLGPRHADTLQPNPVMR